MENEQLAPEVASRLARCEIETFADGECHYFAIAAARLTGLPMVFVANPGEHGPAIGHVALEMPDGALADAAGIWGRESLLASWEASLTLPTDEDDVMRDLCEEGCGPSDYVLGRIAHATLLLEGEGYAGLLRDEAARREPTAPAL